VEDTIARYKRQTKESLHYFMNTLSFVPADKVTWSPTPTAKSTLQIVAHCAGYSGLFAEILRTGRFPCSGDEFRRRANDAIASITTLDEAKAVLEKGIADSLEALDTVKPEQIDGVIDSPQGPTPFIFFLGLPGGHIDGHATQIDYLQTCWDDQEVHF